MPPTPPSSGGKWWLTKDRNNRQEWQRTGTREPLPQEQLPQEHLVSMSILSITGRLGLEIGSNTTLRRSIFLLWLRLGLSHRLRDGKFWLNKPLFNAPYFRCGRIKMPKSFFMWYQYVSMFWALPQIGARTGRKKEGGGGGGDNPSLFTAFGMSNVWQHVV